jgi:hypothetical protein
VVQYFFVRHEIGQIAGEKLSCWADDLRSTLGRNETPNLSALRHSAPKASAFVIVASDGTVIAIHGLVREASAVPPFLEPSCVALEVTGDS